MTSDPKTSQQPRPWRSLITRTNIISAIPVIVALILSGFISFSYNTLIKRYRDDVDHTFLVMSKIDASLLHMQDAETGQRGYVITGDESYLEPFRKAETTSGQDIAELDKLISDNPIQIAHLAEVKKLITAKFSELRDTIELRRRGDFEAARISIANNSGKETMDRIRSLNGEMRDQERALLAERLSNARFVEGLIVLVALIGVTLSLTGRFIAALIRARSGKA